MDWVRCKLCTIVCNVCVVLQRELGGLMGGQVIKCCASYSLQSCKYDRLFQYGQT